MVSEEVDFGLFLASCWVVFDVAGWRKDCKLYCFFAVCGYGRIAAG